MAKEKSRTTKTGRPAKNLSKVTKKPKKETKSDRMTAMVIDAINRLAKKDGLSMAASQRYIADNFHVELSKNNKTIIKKCIGKGFREGRFVMANAIGGGPINYTKRFRMNDESASATEYAETERDTDSEIEE